MILTELVILAISLVLLLKGSDWFVDSAAQIAKHYGISELVIGLTIVAIGTSLPEFATGIAAAVTGNSGLIFGTVLGSNIANIGLVLGIGAMLGSFTVDKIVFKRDAMFLLFTGLLFIFVSVDGVISSLEGIGMFFLFILYISYFIVSKKRHYFVFYLGRFFRNDLFKAKVENLKPGIDYGEFKSISSRIFQEIGKFQFGFFIAKNFFMIALSILMIVVGADFLVESASSLAVSIGVSNELIGFTLIAVGTSLPELAVSISAVRKGLHSIMIGNILGSNITNTLLVLGFSSMIRPITVMPIEILIGIPFLIALSIILILLTERNWMISRKEGAILASLYLLFMLWYAPMLTV